MRKRTGRDGPGGERGGEAEGQRGDDECEGTAHKHGTERGALGTGGGGGTGCVKLNFPKFLPVEMFFSR